MNVLYIWNITMNINHISIKIIKWIKFIENTSGSHYMLCILFLIDYCSYSWVNSYYCFNSYKWKEGENKFKILDLVIEDLRLNFALRISWSEQQSCSGLGFADCIELLHLQLQRRESIRFWYWPSGDVHL